MRRSCLTTLPSTRTYNQSGCSGIDAVVRASSAPGIYTPLESFAVSSLGCLQSAAQCCRDRSDLAVFGCIRDNENIALQASMRQQRSGHVRGVSGVDATIRASARRRIRSGFEALGQPSSVVYVCQRKFSGSRLVANVCRSTSYEPMRNV